MRALERVFNSPAYQESLRKTREELDALPRAFVEALGLEWPTDADEATKSTRR